MKTKLIMLILIVWTLGASAQSSSGGIEFFHGTWAEALAQAKAQEKPLFVDIFSTGYRPAEELLAEEMMKQYSGKDLFFMVGILYALFDVGAYQSSITL